MIHDLNIHLAEMKEVGFMPFALLKNKPVCIYEYEVTGDQVRLMLKSKHGEEYPYDIERDKIEKFLDNFITKSVAVQEQDIIVGKVSNIQDLRQTLQNALAKVAAGQMKYEQVKSICMISQQILNTISAERKFRG